MVESETQELAVNESIIVKEFNLRAPTDLKLLVQIEEPWLFNSYKSKQHLDAFERGILSSLIVKNILKKDKTKM